eukprot:gnl/MRDRNA2_/MRDRNA2_87601_c0_seq1.p1 gnl/MRDRNA2_/MRDRNA2_87601_c0~~gnl/MRDRNA2_/MRDRNA2_87601_c0_seq1.p1  ORF type:complete len:189 (+),score=50.92 gnl/MRDRNA2_/MRDRNA2_87601_c0_seq1:86-652(+)
MAALDATNRSAGPTQAPPGRPTVLLKRGGLTKEEEQAVLQQKLKNASKSAEIHQQKVSALAEMVDNMITRKERAQQNLAKLRRELEEKLAEQAKVKDHMDKTRRRLNENEGKADRIRIIIRKSEMDFNKMIQATGNNAKFCLNRTQGTSSKLTSAELDAERGYTCKKGSTPHSASTGSLAKIAKRGMF